MRVIKGDCDLASSGEGIETERGAQDDDGGVTDVGERGGCGAGKTGEVGRWESGER